MPTLNPNNYAYLWSPTRQILDKNGKPLVGGYVMLNQHGTTGIEALSYSDWNGTLNARRILLDGLGRASAIVENDKLYDMYVYNKFNVLEYSALGVNCTGEGGGESPMRFTSNDGSIDIYRSGNNVDFSVHKDSSTNGTATGDSVNENGLIEFDNVTGDITVISAGSLSVASGKMYHVTLQLEVSMSSYSDQYIDCLMIDSENTSHKFVLDGSRAKQLVDLSWDLSATHSYVRFYVSVPSNASVDEAVLYIHSVNAISVGSGGGVTEVEHDETLTGNGTESNPLGVAESITQEIGSKLSSVSVDGTTITGDGTPEHPLVATAATQQQANWSEADPTKVDYIKNKPNLATVATSGSYNDLSNKPTIPAAQVNSDWNASSGVAEILNKPSIPTKTSDLTNDSGFITASEVPAQVQSDWSESDTTDPSYIQNKPNLAAVATSGSYNDLTDKPAIPSIPVQDVEVNGTSVVNASGVAEVVVPTKTSDLNNDSGFITASQVPAQVNADWNASSGVAQILNKPSLAAVATSGDYQDLSNKPTINNVPAVTSSDDGKVLKASYSGGVGSYEWANESGGTVTDVLVDGSSVVNAQGQAIIAMPTDLVPTVTSSDDGKILTATYSGGQASYAWTSPQTFSQQQSNWAQTNTSAVDYIKNKPQNLVQDASYVHTDNNFTNADKTKLDGIESGAEANVQADWSQSDSAADDYIKNKPQNLVQDASYVHTDNNFTTTLKDKLDGIAAGAEVNVQSDWNQSDSNADDYIKNKPTINNVPVVTSTDDGKVLKASYSGGVGSYSWETESGGTVTDVLVDGSSVVNAQGQAIIAMPTDLVPTVTSSDDGKILTATYSGGQASYAWTAPQTFSQQQSNWTQSDSSAVDYIKNKPSLIPLIAGSNITITESGGALTISSTGSGGGTITDVTVDGASVVNAQGVAAITMPTVPTKTSDLTNDSGFITASQIPAQVQADWNESDSNDPSYIQNKPTIPAAQVNSDWNASTGVAQILNKPDLSVYALSANLATVATSGSYNDLSDKPSIPAAQVNSDWNAVSGVAQIMNKPSIPTIGTITL